MSKVALLDLGKSQNEQSHEVSWVWIQNCRHGAQILGSMGHNGPCPCGIGLSRIDWDTGMYFQNIEDIGV